MASGGINGYRLNHKVIEGKAKSEILRSPLGGCVGVEETGHLSEISQCSFR